MKFKLCEKSNTSTKSTYNIGSLVVLNKKYKFKNPIMQQIVNANHVFVIVGIKNNQYLIYAMTSRISKANQFPKYYELVTSANKTVAVQLNAWGWIPIYGTVHKKIGDLSNDDYTHLQERILEDPNIFRTTVCEHYCDFIREEML